MLFCRCFYLLLCCCCSCCSSRLPHFLFSTKSADGIFSFALQICVSRVRRAVEPPGFSAVCSPRALHVEGPQQSRLPSRNKCPSADGNIFLGLKAAGLMSNQRFWFFFLINILEICNERWRPRSYKNREILNQTLNSLLMGLDFMFSGGRVTLWLERNSDL